MKKLILRFEYKCFPLWIYDENGNLYDNDLPEELSTEKRLDDELVMAQEIYDELFIDDGYSLEFKGFSNTERANQFHTMLRKLEQSLREKAEEFYDISVDYLDI